MVYLGVDLHRKISHVVALDEGGTVVLERRFDHSPDAFRRVFGDLAPEPVSVVFEATYGWGWFADLLADVGLEAHMAHPLATKAISAGRVKNDAVDARTLAHLLRTNLLPEAWIAPPEVRDARRLVRMRVSLVRIRSRLKNQIHAICADAGVPVPVSDLFGRQGRRELASLVLRPIVASRLAANLRLIDELGREIMAADRELQALFRGDDRVRRLMPNPSHRVPDRGHHRRRGRRGQPLSLRRPARLVGRPHPDRAQQCRPHEAGAHQQAGQPLAALDDGRGCDPGRPGTLAPPVRRPDRAPPGRQDREGRPRPPAAGPRLLRPPRSRRLSGVPAAPPILPLPPGALVLCHGLTLTAAVSD